MPLSTIIVAPHDANMWNLFNFLKKRTHVSITMEKSIFIVKKNPYVHTNLLLDEIYKITITSKIKIKIQLKLQNDHILHLFKNSD
jgi:hypothetical protein